MNFTGRKRLKKHMNIFGQEYLGFQAEYEQDGCLYWIDANSADLNKVREVARQIVGPNAIPDIRPCKKEAQQ
ncbi:hypothetical protein [Brucella sp. BO2]|uniref:hypothetical protein n=1 Tax=Brucella sp. BO2 TaxID=693750 RepID=UPI00046D17E4|nr:hypothetical protein [Brucella sp. BO2]